MSEPTPIRKRMGRPPKAPEKGKRQNYTFRMSDTDRDKVVEAAAAAGRSMSEEIEYRIEQSFKSKEVAEVAGAAAAKAVVEAVESTLRDRFVRVARNATHSAFKEYEREIIGHREGFSFGHWMGKALADARVEIAPRLPRDRIWYHDPELLSILKSAAQRQLDFLFDDYRRVEYFGSYTEVFSKVWPIIDKNESEGVYEREAAEGQARIEHWEAEQRAWIEAGRPGLSPDDTKA